MSRLFYLTYKHNKCQIHKNFLQVYLIYLDLKIVAIMKKDQTKSFDELLIAVN